MGVVVVVLIVVVIVGVIIALFGWDRYRDRRTSAGDGNPSAAQPTSEVFVDPETGRRTRVWYDAKTGERDYRSD